MRRAVVLAVVVGGCTDGVVAIAPVYQVPVDDPTATASGLDELQLSVARAGSDDDLVSVSFAPGQAIELAGVPFSDDLVIHLAGRIGATDVAYGRTCAFAVRADQPAPTPHLLFARNVKFATIPVVLEPRRGGAAVTAADGSALVIGGDAPSAGAVVERYDPATATVTAAAAVSPRRDAVAVGFGTGASMRVTLLGGAHADGAGAAEVEHLRVDGAAILVDRLDEPRLARVELTATALTDGRVVVVGGRPPGGAPTGAVEVMAELGGATEVRPARSTLAQPRAGHTATRLGDDVGAPVLIVGGVDPAGAPVAVAELWKPLAGDLADPAVFAPAMVVPRSHHLSQLMPDGSVLIIGGVDAAGAAVRTLERFTLDAGFVAVGDLPATVGVVELSATGLPDGRILLVGGRAGPGLPPLDTAAIARLDLIDGSVDVVATDRLAVPRAGHQAALLCDGTVLISGGTAAPARAERYNPPPTGRR
ncbi:MAG: hypothetical protein R3B06_11745 [Kofleriaceae bacterium]